MKLILFFVTVEFRIRHCYQHFEGTRSLHLQCISVNQTRKAILFVLLFGSLLTNHFMLLALN